MFPTRSLLFLFLLATLACAGEGRGASSAVTFYVALDGNDSWSGKLPAPNAAKTNGPFATFDRARAAVQSLNKSGLSQVVVRFRGGTYFLPQTENFTSADSGTATTEIVYENYPGEKPVFSGGMRVQNWTHAGGNKWQTTLPASTVYFENLFYNGVRRLRPRLGGYLGAYYRIASTVYSPTQQTNCSVQIPDLGWECFDRFQYDPADPIADTWKNLAPPAQNSCNQPTGNSALTGDIEVLDWEQFSTSKLRVSCVDTVNHIVYMTGPTAMPQANASETGFITGNRYLVENVEDALAEPGQWFLDRSSTPWTLTYLANPGEHPNADSVIIPQLPIVLEASSLQYVTFRGLTFEHDNYTPPAAGYVASELEPNIPSAVSFQNSQHVSFESGTVTQTSGSGVEFISCTGKQSPSWCVNTNANATTAWDSVEDSAFYDLGTAGVRIGEPGLPSDSDANVPQFMTVENNVVQGYGRIVPSAFGIGQGMGHDNLYTHNTVYNGYHCAISISENLPISAPPNGNGAFNNTISFNHVYNLLRGIMNDGGSIRVEDGNLVHIATGNRILNNRVHDVTDASIMDANGYGGHGIYMDNQSGLVDVENNLVYRVSASAVYTPHGPALPNSPNTIRNNILAFAQQAMVDDSGPYVNSVPATALQAFLVNDNLFYFDRSSSSNPPFRVQAGCTYSLGSPFTEFQDFSSNLYWRTDGGFGSDPKAFHLQPAAGTGPNAPCSDDRSTWTFYTFTQWQQMVNEDAGSVVRNPGFANPAYPFDDYSLPAGSPGVGFVPFDACEAGVIQRPGHDDLPFRVDEGRPCQFDRGTVAPDPRDVPDTFPTMTFNPATDY